jgi:hypothetical protein
MIILYHSLHKIGFKKLISSAVKYFASSPLLLRVSSCKNTSLTVVSVVKVSIHEYIKILFIHSRFLKSVFQSNNKYNHRIFFGDTFLRKLSLKFLVILNLSVDKVDKTEFLKAINLSKSDFNRIFNSLLVSLDISSLIVFLNILSLINQGELNQFVHTIVKKAFEKNHSFLLSISSLIVSLYVHKLSLLGKNPERVHKTDIGNEYHNKSITSLYGISKMFFHFK